eukprot:6195058-Pleurochrysis_carterae.AAC.1
MHRWKPPVQTGRRHRGTIARARPFWRLRAQVARRPRCHEVRQWRGARQGCISPTRKRMARQSRSQRHRYALRQHSRLPVSS